MFSKIFWLVNLLWVVYRCPECKRSFGNPGPCPGCGTELEAVNTDME
jgi:rRNA maturation endonuclease Nob1